MTNPFAEPAQCECGHEESDHDIRRYPDGQEDDWDDWEETECRFCDCIDWRPKDAEYYAMLAEDAAIERADARRKGYD